MIHAQKNRGILGISWGQGILPQTSGSSMPFAEKKITGSLFRAGMMIFLCWLTGPKLLQAQFQITYPVPAAAISSCQGPTPLTVSLFATGSNLNAQVVLEFPPGIFYVPGSLNKISGNIAVITESNIANLNRPVFSLSPAAFGEQITFAVRREALGCVARSFVMGGGVLKDVVEVVSSAGLSREEDPNLNSYNLLFPSLSLAGQGPVTGIPGQSVSRDISIINGGFGALSGYSFTITEAASGLQTTQLSTLPGGTVIVPVATTVSGGMRTLTYTLGAGLIAQFGDNDLLFENGESMVLRRTYSILNCQTPSNYTVRWGCDEEICQQSTLLQQTNIASGVPRVRLTATTPVALTNMCGNLIYRYTFTNQGTETQAGAGTAFNLTAGFGMNASGLVLSHNAPNATFVGSRVNGVALPFCLSCNGAGMTADLSGLTGPQFGLVDADGDGQYDDLPVGASFVIEIEMRWDCQAGCPVNHSVGGMRVATDYLDQCQASVARLVEATAPSMSLSPLTPLSVEGPADINEGDVFTLQACFAYRESLPDGANFFQCSTNQLLWAIKLPPGFSPVTGSATFRDSPTSFFVSQDTLYVVGNANAGNTATVCYSVDLAFSCASYLPPPAFSMEIRYICDLACACAEKWACYNWVPNVHCGACAEGGLTTRRTLAQRLTTGFTDNTGTTRVDPATLPEQIRKRALPCDTVLVSMWSYQFAGTSGLPNQTWDNSHLRVSYDQLGNQNLLAFGQATARFYDASAGVHTECQLPAPVESVAGGRHILVYDLTSCHGGTLLQPGDSINVFAKAVVLDNPNLTISPTQVAGLRIEHFNLVGGIEYTCDVYGLELYLHRYVTTRRSSAGIRNVLGCNGFVANLGIWANGVASDQYPDEYRPSARLDSVAFIPNTVGVLNPLESPTLSFRLQTGGLAVVTLGTPDRIAANRLVWYNPGNWPIGDEVSDGGTYRLNLPLLPSCASQSGTERIEFYYQKNGYAPAQCQSNGVYGENNTVNITKPDHNLADLTGTVQAVTNSVSWNLQIQNRTNVGSAHLWVALETGNGDLVVSGVRNQTSNNSLTLIPYADGVWVQVQEMLPAAATIDLEVTARYVNCAPDALTASMGWDCAGYPADPLSYPCPRQMTILRAIPQESEVQLELDSEPDGPVPACEPFQFELTINSAQAANVDQVIFQINLPAGLNLTDVLEAEYPRGSGDWVVMTNRGSSDTPVFDLTTHPAFPADGLPGSIIHPASPGRQIGLRFLVETDCGFSPGNVVDFQVFADRPCGEPAQGNGTRVTSSTIQIDGVLVPYVVGTTSGLSGPILGCAQETRLTLEHTIAGSGMTTAQDEIVLTLPVGITFSGALDCAVQSGPPQVGCPTFIRNTLLPNGTRSLVLSMPPNLMAGDKIRYALGLIGEGFAGCGEGEIIRVQTKTTVPGPDCQGVSCPDVQAITSTADIMATIEKPQFTLSDFTAVEFISAEGSSREYAAQLTLTNTSLVADLTAGEQLVVSFFCSNGMGGYLPTPIGAAVLDGPLAAGESAEIQASFAAVCPNNQGLVAVIEGITHAATPPPGQALQEQCLCVTPAPLLTMSLPCYAIDPPLAPIRSVCQQKIPPPAIFVTQNTIPNGIVFVRFTGTEPADPYQGGTILGTATGSGGQVILPGAWMVPVNRETHFFYALQQIPSPVNPLCRPSALLIQRIIPADCGAFPWNGN